MTRPVQVVLSQLTQFVAMGLIYNPVTLAMHQYICHEFDLDPATSLEFVRQYCDARRVGGQRHTVQVEANVRLNPLSNAFTRLRIDTHRHGWFDQLCEDTGSVDLISMPSGRSIKRMGNTEIATSRDIVALPAGGSHLHGDHSISTMFRQGPEAYLPADVPREIYSPLQHEARDAFVRSHLHAIGARAADILADCSDFTQVRSAVRERRFHAHAQAYVGKHFADSTEKEQETLTQLIGDRLKAVAARHKTQIKAYKDIRTRLHAPQYQHQATSRYDDGFSSDEEDATQEPRVQPVTDQERHMLAGEAGFFSDRFASSMYASHEIRNHVSRHYPTRDGRVQQPTFRRVTILPYRPGGSSASSSSASSQSSHSSHSSHSHSSHSRSRSRSHCLRSNGKPRRYRSRSRSRSRSGSMSRSRSPARSLPRRSRSASPRREVRYTPEDGTREGAVTRDWPYEDDASRVQNAHYYAESEMPSLAESSPLGRVPELIPEERAELKVGTHMRLNARRGLYDIRAQANEAVEATMPTLIEAHKDTEKDKGKGKDTGKDKGKQKEKRKEKEMNKEKGKEREMDKTEDRDMRRPMHMRGLYVAAPASDIPDLLDGSAEEPVTTKNESPTATDKPAAVAPAIPIDKELVSTAVNDTRFLTYKFKTQFGAFHECQHMLESQAGAMPANHVIDLSRYTGKGSSVASLLVPYTAAVDDMIVSGDASLVHVEGLNDCYFLITE